MCIYLVALTCKYMFVLYAIFCCMTAVVAVVGVLFFVFLLLSTSEYTGMDAVGGWVSCRTCTDTITLFTMGKVFTSCTRHHAIHWLKWKRYLYASLHLTLTSCTMGVRPSNTWYTGSFFSSLSLFCKATGRHTTQLLSAMYKYNLNSQHMTTSSHHTHNVYNHYMWDMTNVNTFLDRVFTSSYSACAITSGGTLGGSGGASVGGELTCVSYLLSSLLACDLPLQCIYFVYIQETYCVT